MANKIARRNFNNGNADAIIKLMANLNNFCFHDSGADDDCNGCCFEGYAPCPLAEFYGKLEKELGFDNSESEPIKE